MYAARLPLLLSLILLPAATLAANENAGGAGAVEATPAEAGAVAGESTAAAGGETAADSVVAETGDAEIAPGVVPAWFTFSFENDYMFHSDDGYSNGFQFAWSYGPFDQFGGKNTSQWTELLAPRWIKRGEGYKRAVTHHFANIMSTPDDLEATVPPADDIPYSGITYWRTDWMRFNAKHADRSWGTIGLVGEISGSQWLQENMHDVIGATIPEGWDAQVENGVVFELGAERKWRLLSLGSEDLGSDIVAITSANIGNLTTRVDGSVLIRFGERLVRSLPSASLLPGRDVNPVAGTSENTAHVFVGMLYRYEAWNITLDGDIPDPYVNDITREPNLAYVSAGAAGNIGKLGIQLSYTKGTKRFEEADEGDKFGSISFTWRYR